MQPAFKRVAAEVEVCRTELAARLRTRLLAAPDEAAECIQMIANLGEPTESLQEDFLECKRQRMEGLLAAAGLMLKTIAVDKGLLERAGTCSGGWGRASAPSPPPPPSPALCRSSNW